LEIIACGGTSKQGTCETNLEVVKQFAQSWICTILGTFVEGKLKYHITAFMLYVGDTCLTLL
jgi:hypothetical protein